MESRDEKAAAGQLASLVDKQGSLNNQKGHSSEPQDKGPGSPSHASDSDLTAFCFRQNEPPRTVSEGKREGLLHWYGNQLVL